MQTVTRQSRWIAPAAFWILFATSIGLGRRYAWLDTAWYVLGMLVILALAVYSVIHSVRNRGQEGALSSKGIPRWLERFLLDQEADSEPGSATGSKHKGSRFRAVR